MKGPSILQHRWNVKRAFIGESRKTHSRRWQCRAIYPLPAYFQQSTILSAAPSKATLRRTQ